jgi:putative endonuclease
MDSLGRQGEVWLAECLERAGWIIKARNWRRPGLELDLVVQKGDTLAFIEIKTRRRGPLHPLELLPYRKALHDT